MFKVLLLSGFADKDELLLNNEAAGFRIAQVVQRPDGHLVAYLNLITP